MMDGDGGHNDSPPSVPSSTSPSSSTRGSPTAAMTSMTNDTFVVDQSSSIIDNSDTSITSPTNNVDDRHSLASNHLHVHDAAHDNTNQSIGIGTSISTSDSSSLLWSPARVFQHRTYRHKFRIQFSRQSPVGGYIIKPPPSTGAQSPRTLSSSHQSYSSPSPRSSAHQQPRDYPSSSSPYSNNIIPTPPTVHHQHRR
jgi:hypothetical protein